MYYNYIVLYYWYIITMALKYEKELLDNSIINFFDKKKNIDH
jgi:hypothetical protein